MEHVVHEELKALDLQKRHTIYEIVEGMSDCALQARRLGEGLQEIIEMIESPQKPILVYDGKPETQLAALLCEMTRKKWFKEVLLPEEYAKRHTSGESIVVVGRYSERHEDALLIKPVRSLFINNNYLPKPDEIRDGDFRNEISIDPRFAMPILFRALEERFEHKATRVPKLMDELERYGGVATQTARAARTFLEMRRKQHLSVFLTLSGVLTIAKLDLVLCEMIERGMVDAVLTTGALVGHGVVTNVGRSHFKHDPKLDDAMLAQWKYNRVTDVWEPEENLDFIEEIENKILDEWDPARPLSSRILCHLFGKYLSEHYPHERGILKSAYEKETPVFIPALNDSELWNNYGLDLKRREYDGRKKIFMDFTLDTEYRVEMKMRAKRLGYDLGFFIVGGGVPKNNLLNDAPYVEIQNVRLGLNLPEIMFSSGVRICPDRPQLGNASSATGSEMVSWRKVIPGAPIIEVIADAIPILPFIVKYVMEMEG